jgi:hypothetical protein
MLFLKKCPLNGFHLPFNAANPIEKLLFFLNL